MNVAAYLPERAAAQPGQAAVVAVAKAGSGWRSTSFAELDRRTDAIARGLAAHGIRPGERTLVMVRPGLDLIALTYALFKAAAVPVLIDPGMGLRAFLRCVADTRPSAFIGIPLAQAARLLFPRSFRDVERVVTVGPRLFWGGASLEELERSSGGAPILRDAADDAIAAILFTSGSTGPAKGAVYTHGNFRAQAEVLGRCYGFRAGEVDLAAFPLFSLFDCAFGMTSVIPDLDASRPGRCDPARVADALAGNRCTTAFGSPAIWRRLVPYCRERGQRFPELKRVLVAGAAVAPALVEALRQLMAPDGDVHTPYGATEALPVATISGSEVAAETGSQSRAGKGTCVGRPVPGIQLRVIGISDEEVSRWSDALVLPPGEVGEICVKGPMVTRAYFGRDDAAAAAKIADGDGVWHRMGDLGYQDEQGRLWFAGRKAERVRTAAGPAFTDFVEGRASAHPRVARCALVGVGAAGRERPVLVVEGRGDASLARELQALAPVQTVLFHPRFPVDARHNAKIHRLTLKRWAEARLAAQS